MNKRDIKYKLVDTAGQITAVVFNGFKENNLALISKKLMQSNKTIEQVVFNLKNKIQTMGNELCINGSLAGAYLMNKKELEISGIDKQTEFIRDKNFISILLPKNIVQVINKNIIKLSGIVYIISNNKNYVNKEYLKSLAIKYSVPASGIIKYKSNKITPIVYVKTTNTLVKENACGSGSLCYFIYSGISIIIQPSSKRIVIKKIGDYFLIKSPIKTIN